MISREEIEKTFKDYKIEFQGNGIYRIPELNVYLDSTINAIPPKYFLGKMKVIKVSNPEQLAETALKLKPHAN